MTADPLFEELTVLLESRREAQWVLDDLDEAAPEARRELAMAMAGRRAKGEPLQYVLGHWPFRTIDLAVDERALIPRPETEQLVDLALGVLLGADGPAIACDLGCGTGAIALSIAVEARALGVDVEIVATDVSADALALARSNARRVHAGPVRFFEGTWFEALPADYEGAIALLCSNPPYVAATEREHLARELDFEPSIALVADDGTDGTPGFGALESIIREAPRWLAPGATLLLEHGAAQRDAVIGCSEAVGFVDVQDHPDLSGLPRVLEARRP